mmetsp:Transcript_28318/g.66447  ORF Transcript_28318/g.66447 Transcript_28318/m.66447 type:complete len:276 (-) Transcript_28318:2462-3289(-)
MFRSSPFPPCAYLGTEAEMPARYEYMIRRALPTYDAHAIALQRRHIILPTSAFASRVLERSIRHGPMNLSISAIQELQVGIIIHGTLLGPTKEDVAQGTTSDNRGVKKEGNGLSSKEDDKANGRNVQNGNEFIGSGLILVVTQRMLRLVLLDDSGGVDDQKGDDAYAKCHGQTTGSHRHNFGEGFFGPIHHCSAEMFKLLQEPSGTHHQDGQKERFDPEDDHLIDVIGWRQYFLQILRTRGGRKLRGKLERSPTAAVSYLASGVFATAHGPKHRQ